jgi:hypothetical protein
MKIKFILIAILAFASCGGCVYFTDRGNDFADIFTLRAGVSYGLSARVQVTDYFGLGLGWHRGLMSGFIGRDTVNRREAYMGFVLESGTFPDRPRPTLKTGREGGTVRLFLPISDGLGPRHVFPADFRVEADVTLGVFGIALGFNPVELADFAAGIFGVDFAMDDSFWRNDFERLKDKLVRGEPVEKAAAESRLAELKPPGASASLITMLPDTADEKAFAALLSTVLSIEDPSAAAGLKDILTKVPPKRRADVLDAVSALDRGPDFVPFTETVFAACDDTEYELATTALRLLWERNYPETPKRMAVFVGSEHNAFPYWREALDYIAASGSKEAGDALFIAQGGGPNWLESEEAYEFFGKNALALGELGENQCYKLLFEALAGDDFSAVWRDVAIALGKLGDKAALPLIAQRIGENPRGKFAFVLAHLYLDRKTYADEMIDMLRPLDGSAARATDDSGDVPVEEAVKALKTDIEACALLLEAGRPEILGTLSELLKQAASGGFADNYYVFNRPLGRIESAFEDLGGSPRSDSFRTHRFRIDGILKYIKQNWERGKVPLLYWDAEKGKFAARRPK